VPEKCFSDPGVASCNELHVGSWIAADRKSNIASGTEAAEGHKNAAGSHGGGGTAANCGGTSKMGNPTGGGGMPGDPSAPMRCNVSNASLEVAPAAGARSPGSAAVDMPACLASFATLSSELGSATIMLTGHERNPRSS